MYVLFGSAVNTLSTQKVTYPIPVDFPAKNAISLKSEKDFLNKKD